MCSKNTLVPYWIIRFQHEKADLTLEAEFAISGTKTRSHNPMATIAKGYEWKLHIFHYRTYSPELTTIMCCWIISKRCYRKQGLDQMIGLLWKLKRTIEGLDIKLSWWTKWNVAEKKYMYIKVHKNMQRGSRSVYVFLINNNDFFQDEFENDHKQCMPFHPFLLSALLIRSIKNIESFLQLNFKEEKILGFSATYSGRFQKPWFAKNY